MKRPIVSIADAFRACAALRPMDTEARSYVRALLGLGADDDLAAPEFADEDTPAHQPASEKLSVHRNAPWVAAPTDATSQGQPSAQQPSTSADKKPSVESRTHQPCSLRRLYEIQSDGTPDWLASVAPLSSFEDAGLAESPPLFDRQIRRGLLIAALATQVFEGELDQLRLLGSLAAGKPVKRLPRLSSFTVRQGVQVLLDTGPSMDPFRDDQSHLATAMGEVFTPNRVEILHFSRCPSRGVRVVGRQGRVAWHPPVPGASVVLITDFGIGGPLFDQSRATTSEWLDFARIVADAGHQLVAFVPYAPKRWPRSIQAAISVVHWSERTSVNDIQRVVRNRWKRFVP